MIETSTFNVGKQRKVQQIYNYGGTATLYRVCDNDTWHDWVQNYDTAMLTNSALLSPLASALGVGSTYISLSSGQSFNSIPAKEGYYLVDATAGVTDAPFEITSNMTFIVRITGLSVTSGKRYIQEVFSSLLGQGKYENYYTRYIGAGSVFTNPWTKLSIPSFLSQYNDLSSLASALGAFKAMGSIPTNVNWDSTALKSGIYLIENYSWVSGLPDDAVTGILVIFRTNDSSNNFRVALFFTAEDTNRKFFYNIYRASWGGWQQA